MCRRTKLPGSSLKTLAHVPRAIRSIELETAISYVEVEEVMKEALLYLVITADSTDITNPALLATPARTAFFSPSKFPMLGRREYGKMLDARDLPNCGSTCVREMDLKKEGGYGYQD